MNINADELQGRIYMLIQDFDPDIKGCNTWDDALRAVVKIIEKMMADTPRLKDMTPDQRREYYTMKQRESRFRKRIKGEKI